MNYHPTIILDQKMEETMKCSRCGVEINRLNHYYIPQRSKKGYRLCIQCAKKEKIITLV